MRHLSILCLCFLIAVLSGGRVAAAQAGTPAGAIAAAPLDLATMMLIPSDVKRPHATNWSGGPLYLDSYSARRATALKAAGFIGGFEQLLEPPTTDRDYQIASLIGEFKDARSAATGYQLGLASGAGVSGVKTVGDKSVLYRSTDTDPYDSSRPDHGLTLVFRLGRLVGTIYVDDYTGNKPHAAEAVALGDAMVARIKRVLAGDPTKPGLSNRVVRFKVPVTASFQDGYYLLNGKDQFGWEGNLSKDQPNFAETFPGATNVLLVGQSASMETGAPWERVRMVEFPTTKAASAWLKVYLTLAERGPSGWQKVRQVAGARTFGDESRTVTFQWPAAQGEPGKTVYGTAVITRFGALAVSFRVEAYHPVPVQIVDGLMAAQAKCVKSTALCPRVTPSKALLDLTVKPSTGWAQPASAMAMAVIAESRRIPVRFA